MREKVKYESCSSIPFFVGIGKLWIEFNGFGLIIDGLPEICLLEAALAPEIVGLTSWKTIS